ncbi:hypothetical protein Tco_0526921 [Tanacetum coccineum]
MGCASVYYTSLSRALLNVMNKIIKISSNSSEDKKGASTQGLLDAYGYNTIEEYLSWNYFPSIDNESTDMETIDKRNTDKDYIIDSNSAMSKACTLHLQLAYAYCICTLHLQLAFAHCTCTLPLQAKVLIKTLLKVKQVENKQREKKPRFNKQFL